MAKNGSPCRHCFFSFYIFSSVYIFTKAIHVASKAQCVQAHDVLHKKNSIKVDFLLMLNPQSPIPIWISLGSVSIFQRRLTAMFCFAKTMLLTNLSP